MCLGGGGEGKERKGGERRERGKGEKRRREKREGKERKGGERRERGTKEGKEGGKETNMQVYAPYTSYLTPNLVIPVMHVMSVRALL